MIFFLRMLNFPLATVQVMAFASTPAFFLRDAHPFFTEPAARRRRFRCFLRH